MGLHWGSGGKLRAKRKSESLGIAGISCEPIRRRTSHQSRTSKYPGYPWEVRHFGAPESAVMAFCKSDFDEKIGDLECSEGIGTRFLFNRKSLRFTLFSAPAGYINSGIGDLGELPAPTMEIGRCSPV